MKICATVDDLFFQVLRNGSELLQSGLQVFYNFGGDHIGVGEVRAVFQRLVFEPENVQVDLVALDQFFVVEGIPSTFSLSVRLVRS